LGNDKRSFYIKFIRVKGRNKTGRVCGTKKNTKGVCKSFWENMKEDLGVEGKIILKWIYK
jgi:hypothetical protein